jgi:hypothetical protein
MQNADWPILLSSINMNININDLHQLFTLGIMPNKNSEVTTDHSRILDQLREVVWKLYSLVCHGWRKGCVENGLLGNDYWFRGFKNK